MPRPGRRSAESDGGHTAGHHRHARRILVWEFETSARPRRGLDRRLLDRRGRVMATGLRARISKFAALRSAAGDGRRAVAARRRGEPGQGRVSADPVARAAHAAELHPGLGAAARQRQTERSADTRAVAAIERAGWAQSHLIENLLDVSRIVDGRLLVTPRPTMVQPVIEGAIDTVGQAAELKRVVIETHLDPGWEPSRSIPIACTRSSGIWSRTPSSSHRQVAALPSAPNQQATH